MKDDSPVRLAALTRLFSAAVFREMAKKGQSSLFSSLIKQACLPQEIDEQVVVGDIFDSAFDILKTVGNRDEYVYRAAITQKILMGKHSLRTASMLNEFRIGKCKADIVILNGTATVYEIKSERDSLARLVNQVDSYRRFFSSVNVIASEDHIKNILDIVPSDVGVMCLSRRYRIVSIREAADCPERVCPVTIFDSLRLNEGVAILQAMGINVPDVPNTLKRTVMRELFSELDPVALHIEMVRTLKRTRNLEPLAGFVTNLPKSLQAAALSITVRRSDHSNLLNAINTPLHAAMKWS